jgi:hypothetical protein
MNGLTLFLQTNPVILSVGVTASVITVGGLVIYLLRRAPMLASLLWRNAVLQPSDAMIVSPEPIQQCVDTDSEIKIARLRAMIRHFFKCFGDDARYNYFADRVQNEEGLNRLYREAFESLQRGEQFGALAQGTEEWVKIGYYVLSKRHPKWGGVATKNQLYAALYKTLASGGLSIPGGERLADTVGAMVVERSWIAR